MIAINSKSYPYLAIAQATAYDYGDLLNNKSLEEIIEMQNNIKAFGYSIGINYDEVRNVGGIDIWNAAIEKAAEIAVSDYHITKEEILKLKLK